jgi:thiol-disulfide isomerase/thioredoxin
MKKLYLIIKIEENCIPPYKDIVLEHDKDVLIQFYAPWCEYCKSMESAWTELGESLLDDNNIVIARMDASANHPPRFFAYDGFPTIYWSGMGRKVNQITEQFVGVHNVQYIVVNALAVKGQKIDILYFPTYFRNNFRFGSWFLFRDIRSD